MYHALVLIQASHQLRVLIFVEFGLVGELLVLLFIFGQHLVFDQRFLIQQFYGLAHLDGGVQVLLLLDSFKFVFLASELLMFLAALLKLAKEFRLGAVEDISEILRRSWLLLS